MWYGGQRALAVVRYWLRVALDSSRPPVFENQPEENEMSKLLSLIVAAMFTAVTASAFAAPSAVAQDAKKMEKPAKDKKMDKKKGDKKKTDKKKGKMDKMDKKK